MRILVCFIVIVGSVALAIYLSIYLMLYGGIMQVVNNWGINTSAVVWGIIRAVFFEVALLPSYLIIIFGTVVLSEKNKD